ncbi:MAG: hypothetical protein WBB45_03810 [Cyclobacteriaceae bacterium]
MAEAKGVVAVNLGNYGRGMYDLKVVEGFYYRGLFVDEVNEEIAFLLGYKS